MARPYCLYDHLSVTPDAQPAVVEAAYRALMKQHHPDHAGAAQRAAEINAAYSVLRDPQRRAAYDQREWARKQEMLAAEAEHLIAPSRFSARAGWILAALLGLLVAALGGERYGLTVVPDRAAQAKAPTRSAAPSLEEEVDALAAAALALTRPAEPAAVAAASSPQAVPPAPESVPAASRSAAARAPTPLRRRAVTRPVAAGTANAPGREAAEGDFMEREGFIY